jgi:hypothetical protein
VNIFFLNHFSYSSLDLKSGFPGRGLVTFSEQEASVPCYAGDCVVFPPQPQQEVNFCFLKKVIAYFPLTRLIHSLFSFLNQNIIFEKKYITCMDTVTHTADTKLTLKSMPFSLSGTPHCVPFRCQKCALSPLLFLFHFSP